MNGSRSRRLALLLVLAVPLGGCHSVFSAHFARHAAPEYKQLVRIDGAAEPTGAGSATAQGRAHLAAGEPGTAAESFQRALGMGEPIAPAANGLGVAYAELGRYDLAYRFFAQAISADPANRQYLQNLARLDQTQRLAAERDAKAARDLADARSAVVTPIAARPAPPRTAGQLQRVSGREVRLVLAGQPLGGVSTNHAAPLRPSGPRITATEPGPRFRPVIRIVFGAATDRQATPPAPTFIPVIRFSLADLKRSAP